MAFDLDGFRRAYTGLDAEAWVAYYAESAEWVEYGPGKPPRAPRILTGKAAIADFVRGVARAQLTLDVSEEIVACGRVAFRATATFPDGRQVVEHVQLTVEDGLIVRQVDVEAWDP